ncbi:branched-chain amino acid ABC transporter permease [Streptomyces sp. AgN23]|uniref:branched-chain amino acid ABC transporter permease n=1 Tax=Streptomyces sp. AgN23 TaxID=1188315 RepID=UPI001B334D31|nr:branched-chain amino acid ABC transporter permease [Streptomyces sp. AgN23]QTI87273.1 branched-chain amino acid ABC transporter permease [Streptomyces sp. AgN23]
MYLLQTLVDGLSLGSLYAVFALGVALVFGVMGLINFAHGELIMIGAYAAVLVVRPVIWVVLAVPVLVMAAALLMERVAFRPVRDAAPTTMLVTSFALSSGLQSAATSLFGSLQRNADVLPALSHSVRLGALRIPVLDLVTVGTGVVMMAGLALFFARTSTGIRMRAAAEDFPTARMLGVKANRVIALAFALSGLCAGAGALLLVSQTGYATPTLGTAPVLAAFIAVVVGGIGEIRGAVLGGYLLGLVTVALQAYLPPGLRSFQTAFAYAVVLAFLVIRPQGILPGKVRLI